MTAAIALDAVTKTYAGSPPLRAVDAISLSIEPGEVVGLLGPNGAGKTTTLRMLLGLIRPTAGRISVLGHAPGSPAALARTGALIETPAFYPYLSGRDNLRVLARYAGRPLPAVDEALDAVDLAERSGDRFAAYSLGMKQRLGVAAALMKDPSLIVLDEPTNGLDPAGMRDMRALIERLGAEGRTVLLSSHLLAEVQAICRRVAVVDHGRIVVDQSVAELRGQGELVVGATPLDRAAKVVSALPGVEEVRIVDGVLRLRPASTPADEVARAVVGAGLGLVELRREARGLEDVFMELTSGGAEK